MAASGINEHHEARRKERVILKQAKWRKQMETMPDGQVSDWASCTAGRQIEKK